MKKTIAVSVFALVLFVALLVVSYMAWAFYRDKNETASRFDKLSIESMKWEFVRERFSKFKEEVLNFCKDEYPKIENADIVGSTDKIEIRLYTDDKNWPDARYHKISDSLKTKGREFFSFPSIVVGIYDLDKEPIIKEDYTITKGGDEEKDEKPDENKKEEPPDDG